MSETKEMRGSKGHVEIRRWNDTHGNTYFSATLHTPEGGHEKIIEFEYGYGTHGLYCAARELDVTGPRNDRTGVRSPDGPKALTIAGYTYSTVDVKRKGDL